MLIALVAASAALPVPIQEPADLHPSSATLVVQFPDVQGMLGAWRTTGLAQLLGDVELHGVIGQFMGGEGAEPVDPMVLLMDQYEQGVEEGEIPPFFDYLEGLKSGSFSVDVAGSDVVALVQGAKMAEDPNFYWAQNVGLRAVLDFVDEPSCEAVTTFLVGHIGSNGPRGMTLGAKALPLPEGANGFGSSSIWVWSFVPSEAGNGASTTSLETQFQIVSGGTRLAMFTGDVDSATYVQALSTGSVESPATPHFAPGRAAFGSTPGACSSEFYLAPFVEDLLAAEMPDSLPALDLVEALMGPGASMLIRGGHWALSIEDGQFVTEGYHDPSQGGPLSGVIGAQPLDPAALTLVHPTALITSVTSLNPDVLANMIVMLAEEKGDGILDDIEANFDFRPERDLAGALGNAASFSLPPLSSIMSAPNLMGAISLNDKAAFTHGMDGLLAMGEGLGDNVQLVRDEYKDAMMYTLSFTGGFDLPMGNLPIDPASFFKPTITVMDDRVLLTTLSSHARKEVRRVREQTGPGKTPDVHEKISAMGDLGGATTVGYADWPTFLGAFYSQMKNIVPLLGVGGGLPFDPSYLPEADLLTRHFKPSENWTRIKDGKVLQYAKSSLGLESTIGPALAAIFMGFYGTMEEPDQMVIAEVDWESMPTDADVSGIVGSDGSSVKVTEDTLMLVDVALTLYQSDHKGAAPATLESLLEKTDMFPTGYLDGDTVPMDGWGRTLVYKSTDAGFELYSMGPNGADNGGTEDDVSAN